MAWDEMDEFTRELYIRLYRQSPIAVDCLAYTDHLDWIARVVQHLTDDPIDPRDVFRNLIQLRKHGDLDLKGKVGIRPRVKFSKEDQALIKALYEGQPLASDNLPYTDEFERMFAEFHRRSATTTTRALFFCAVLNKRKKGELPRKFRNLSADDGIANQGESTEEAA